MNSPFSKDSNDTASSQRSLDWLALVFALTFPTLITYIYFQLLGQSGASSQQFAYGIGKVLQFAFPAIWIACFYRFHLRTIFGTPDAKHFNGEVPQDSSSVPKQMLLAIGFGLATAVALFAIYFLFFQGSAIGDRVAEMAKQKVTSIGIASPWKYIAVGVFYTIVHSFMEEYYWRWFVFWLGKKLFPNWTANLVSSLGFAAHHVILLGFFLGWDSPMAYVSSLCIAVGGVFWAWLYSFDGRLKYCWISHAMVDAAIFGLGYFIVADCFQA